MRRDLMSGLSLLLFSACLIGEARAQDRAMLSGRILAASPCDLNRPSDKRVCDATALPLQSEIVATKVRGKRNSSRFLASDVDGNFRTKLEPGSYYLKLKRIRAKGTGLELPSARELKIVPDRLELRAGSAPFLLRVAHRERKLQSVTNPVGAAISPVCEGAGTRAEGWYVGGSLLSFANCSHQVIRCSGIGSRSEGWYAYERSRLGRIAFAGCSSDARPPVCDAVGSSTEGWYLNGSLIEEGLCAGQVAECDLLGSRSEGWYAVSYSPVALVAYAKCS